MRKLKCFFVLTAFAGLQLNAQDTSVKKLSPNELDLLTNHTVKPAAHKWVKGASINIGVTQIGNSNWIAAGGDKFSIAGMVSINAFAGKKWGRYSIDNMLDINYGIVNTTSLGNRKVNDRIDLLSKYTYQPKKWKKASYGVLGQVRSQISNGYEYDYMGTAQKRRNSGFFAPAYIIISPGINWKPTEWFTFFGSPLTTRWTVVSNGPYSYKAQGGVFNGKQEMPLAKIYGVDPDRPNRGEFGTFFTAILRKNILTNVNYFSKFDFYFSYIRNANNVTGRNRPDFFWTNQFRFKVNKFINVSYGLDMLYDDDIASPKSPGKSIGLQVLSTFGIGFAAKL